MAHLQGPTLSDMKGHRRYRKLRTKRADLCDQVVERLHNIALIEHEMSELEPEYLRALVDRVDLPPLRKEVWLP